MKIKAKDLKKPKLYYRSSICPGCSSQYRTLELEIRSAAYDGHGATILTLTWQMNTVPAEWGGNTALRAYGAHAEIPLECSFAEPLQAIRVLGKIISDRGYDFSPKMALRALKRLGIHRRVWAENPDNGRDGYVPRKYKAVGADYLRALALVAA